MNRGVSGTSNSNSKSERYLCFKSPFIKGGLRGILNIHKILPIPPLEKEGIANLPPLDIVTQSRIPGSSASKIRHGGPASPPSCRLDIIFDLEMA